MKLKVRTAMRTFAAIAIICDIIAVVMADSVIIGSIITMGVVSALMVGYTYINATKDIVNKSGIDFDTQEI